MQNIKENYKINFIDDYSSRDQQIESIEFPKNSVGFKIM